MDRILRVLIADDDDPIRHLLATILARRGFEVDCVRDGAEAIARLGNASYDAILLDLMMPVVSGFEVISYLERTAPDVLKSCVIVLTAVANTELRKLEGKEIFRVIRKPFDLKELAETVSECLERPDGEERDLAAGEAQP